MKELKAYKKVKENFKKYDNISFEKKNNDIIIYFNDKIINYGLRFIAYSEDNLKNFINYWQYKVKGVRKND